MTRYAIGLGSNVGDRIGTLRSAVSALSRHGDDIRVSGLYETDPIGGVEQGTFLNAVLIGEFNMNPHGMLDLVLEIEADHGRDRGVEERWGPRTLDLDLLATESQPVETARLTIPHPRAHEREFVLRPLVDVWPAAPLVDGDAASHLEETADQGVSLLAEDWLTPPSSLRPTALVAGQMALIALIGLVAFLTGDLGRPWSAVRVLGALIGLAGAAVALDSSRRIGPAMTASPMPRPNAVLVDDGVFRVVRHPIYLGVVMVMLGGSLAVASPPAALLSLLLIPYFHHKARFEETQLKIAVPGYSEYARRVTHRLIPFVL